MNKRLKYSGTDKMSDLIWMGNVVCPKSFMTRYRLKP